MFCTDQQILRFWDLYSQTGNLAKSTMKADISEKTGRTYLKGRKLPSVRKEEQERNWRTRKNPFHDDWEQIVQMLSNAPELEAKTIFEHLCEVKPHSYQEGQLRTLQRRIREWRSLQGPPKEVFFPQEHKPGEFLQTDWTNAKRLKVTIDGDAFPHLLCHTVLPYSNWQSVLVCQSESFQSCQNGFQKAIFRLNRIPRYHKTDNSSAVTHYDKKLKRRPFNGNYLEMMSHYDVTPKVSGIGKKEQNGDVESLNNSLKRKLEQHLLLRGCRNFASISEYEVWIDEIIDKSNRLRSKRFREDMASMRPLSARKLTNYRVIEVKVSSWSTIRVHNNSYSVPARLIGEWVKVRSYENRLEIYFAGKFQLKVRRLTGNNGAVIDYRHLIWSLVRKPGAFERYRYREEMFPSMVFRKAYDSIISSSDSQYRADQKYLRILYLSATHMESDVEAGLLLCLEADIIPDEQILKDLMGMHPKKGEEISPLVPDLSLYDELLREKVVGS